MQNKINHDRNLFYRTWKECEEIFQTAEGIVICVGSVEQHGLHLPMGTDTILTEAIMQRVCEKTGLYYYPCTTFGQVWSAKDYAGTVSIPQPVLEVYLDHCVRSVRRFTARHIFLYSFHKGNAGALKNVARSLYDTEGWENIYVLDNPSIEAEAKTLMTTPLWNGVWHAGELETALMLYVAEELVHMDRATCEYPETPWDYRLRSVPWKTFLRSGAFGDTTAATKELGEDLFRLWTDGLCRTLREVSASKRNA